MRIQTLRICWMMLLAIAPICSGAEDGSRAADSFWKKDYHAGLELAQTRGKFALVWFFAPEAAGPSGQRETGVLEQAAIMDRIQEHCVPIKMSIDTTVASDGKQVVLLDHAAFAEMQHAPGLAMIDMTNETSPQFRQVVSIYPFSHGMISTEKLAILLDLPRGTLTQRTLIFAVRTHPEHPASTTGHFSFALSRETESHAWHQASITLQGHHNWNSRFHAINAELPGGLVAREVCAESWPGQSLLDAAEECVHSWRQSPGHWEAVRSRHRLFSYDMKRGVNGVWYAAGIFAGPN